MTKRDLYEFAIKLIGLCSLLVFVDRLPSLMQSFSGSLGPFLFLLLAIVFIVKGETLAGYMVGGHNAKIETQPSLLNAQDLLFVAVKVLGLYWLVYAVIEMRLFLLILACILVFGTKHILLLLNDNNLEKALSELKQTLPQKDGSSHARNSPVYRQEAPVIPASKSQVNVEEIRSEPVNIRPLEQNIQDSPANKISENRKKPGFFSEIFGKPK